MDKCLNQLKKYVPRHLRLGICCDSPVLNTFQDVVESVPVVRDDGTIVTEHKILKSVPAGELMSKYRMSSFRLSAMVRNGVPLKMVNINHSSSFTIGQLRDVCASIEHTEEFYTRLEAEKNERASWFKDLEPSSANE